MPIGSALLAEEYEQVKFHVTELNHNIFLDKMNRVEEDFVRQMAARQEEYEERMHCTFKQMNWLGELYDRYVNGHEPNSRGGRVR